MTTEIEVPVFTAPETKPKRKQAPKEFSECHPYRVYFYRGIYYVPHYTQDCYVGPGAVEYSVDELIKGGAVPDRLYLRHRAKIKPLPVGPQK